MHVYITVIFKDNWLRKNEPSKMAWLRLKCLFSLVPFTNVHTSAHYDNFRLYCIEVDVNKYYLEFYAE